MNKCAVVLLLASLASAQTRPPELAPEQIVYEFKNVTDRAQYVVSFVQDLMDGRVRIHLDQAFNTAIIRQGQTRPTAEDMAKAEELLRRYDVAPAPRPAAEFVAYLVRAANRSSGQAEATGRPGQPIPPVLQDAITEMKSTFPYTDYTLLDTVATEVRNHAQVEDMLPGVQLNNGTPYFYEINYGDTSVSPDRKTVTVKPFKFSVRIPVYGGAELQYQTEGITTDVAIQEGQKLVLGKVRTAVQTPADIFLVLTLKLN